MKLVLGIVGGAICGSIFALLLKYYYETKKFRISVQSQRLDKTTLVFVLKYLKDVMLVFRLYIVEILKGCERCWAEGVCENHRDLFNFLVKLDILQNDIRTLSQKYFLIEKTKTETIKN